MTSDRIKQIQQATNYPESVSVQQALLKVWNECEQDKVKNISSKPMLVSDSEQPLLVHHCGNELTEKEILYDHCLKCSEYLQED